MFYIIEIVIRIFWNHIISSKATLQLQMSVCMSFFLFKDFQTIEISVRLNLSVINRLFRLKLYMQISVMIRYNLYSLENLWNFPHPFWFCYNFIIISNFFLLLFLGRLGTYLIEKNNIFNIRYFRNLFYVSHHSQKTVDYDY